MGDERIKVLVAFDGSQLAMEAVKYVATIMPIEKTDVVLFYIETKMAKSFWEFEQKMEHRSMHTNLRACITQQHKRINSAMDQAFRILEEVGFPKAAIQKKIRAKKSGVVSDIVRECQDGYHALVIGRSGDSKIKDMLLGNTPMKLLKKIQRMPMIIVGGASYENRMMVAFDGSKEVMRAVKAMTGLLGASDCKVSFCHVIPHQGRFQKEDPDWKEKKRKQIEPLVGQARRWLVEAGFAFNQICCEFIDNKQELSTSIVEKANAEKYDTIVIGRRGLSTYQDFVSKRVGENIFRKAEQLTVWVFG